MPDEYDEQVQIDDLAARFEHAWRTDESPSIENYLEQRGNVVPAKLLTELVAVEVELRQNNGEVVLKSEYVKRFPEHLAALKDIFPETVSRSASHASTHIEPRLEDWEMAATITGRFDKAAAAPDTPVTRFGDFDLLDEIARGGMGVVYRARQRSLNRIVALKMILSGHFARADDIERFQREAEAAAALQSPNIVRVFEIGQHEGQHYFTMEFVEGQSLNDKLKDNGPLCQMEAGRLLKVIADAVGHAHSHGVIHRDLKPANVLLNKAGTPQVTDFGLARNHATESGLTMSGQIMGTPSYMPPEQARGQTEQIDFRSDIYSLGAILYCLLTGRPPFQGVPVSETLRQVVEDDVVQPRTLSPALDRDVETICLKCLEKDQDRRYQTTDELTADLDAWLGGRPIAARPVSKPERIYRWCRRNPWPTVLGVVMLVALAGTLMVNRELVAAGKTEKRLRFEETDQRYLAEARLVQFRQHVAALELQNGSPEAAAAALSEIHPRLRSWDTRHLEQQAALRPHPIMRLVEGNWQIVSISINDRDQLVACDAAGTVAVWDVTRGKLLRRLTEGRVSQEHRRTFHIREETPDGVSSDCISCVAWGNSDSIVAGSWDGNLSVLDPTTGTVSAQRDLDASAWTIASSIDQNSCVVALSNGDLMQFSVPTLEPMESITGGSPALCLEPLDSSDGWLIGRADGTVEHRSESLELTDKVQVDGPIWAIDHHRETDGRIIGMVAHEAPFLTILTTTSEDHPLKVAQSVVLPRNLGKALHAVTMTANSEHVIAGDDAGNIHVWPLQDFQAITCGMSFPTGHTDERLVQIEKSSHIPLKRRTALLESLQDGRLLVGGTDATITKWGLPQLASGRAKQETLQLPVTRSSQAAFDSEGHVWVISEDGTLCVINPDKPTILSRQKAHTGGAADIVAVEGFGVFTAGGDTNLKLWRWDEKKVAPREIRKLTARATLLSVDVSLRTRRVAAVDHEPSLHIWDLDTGALLHSSKLGLPGLSLKPTSGRVAFNADGSLVAAFGSRQILSIFDSQTGRAVNATLPTLAESGGTAMEWSPTNPDVILCSDASGLSAAALFGDTLDARLRAGVPMLRSRSQSICRDMTSTSNGQRIVQLYDDGAIQFRDPQHLNDMYSCDSSLSSPCSVAFSSDGGRMALVDESGTLELWQTASENAKNDRVTQSVEWKTTSILAEADSPIQLNRRLPFLNSHDEVALCYVLDCPDTGAGLGTLHVRSGNETRQIFIDGPDHRIDQLIDIRNVDIRHHGKNEATIVFRRENQVPETLHGTFHRVEIGSDGELRDQKRIHNHSFLGHQPKLLIDPQSNRETLVHLARLPVPGRTFPVISKPTDDETLDWAASYIPGCSDGDQFSFRTSKTGSTSILFAPRRYPEDVVPWRIGTWSRDEIESETISAAMFENVEFITTLRSGSDLLVGTVSSNELATRELTVVKCVSNVWTTLATVPVGSLSIHSNLVITDDETIHLAGWNEATSQFRWIRFQDDRWNSSPIITSESLRHVDFLQLALTKDGHLKLLAANTQNGGPVHCLESPRMKLPKRTFD